MEKLFSEIKRRRPDSPAVAQPPQWDALVQECYRHPNDPETTGALFERLRPLLLATLAGVYPGDVAIAEDAVQNALLKLLAMFKKGPPRKLTEGFFVVTARNSLLDELRRRKGEVAFDQLVRQEPTSIETTTHEEEAFELRLRAVQAGITRLDPRCRFLLERYYIGEVESSVLAQTLRLAPDSIHMALKRCRDRLRALLLSSEVASPHTHKGTRS
jgi:RNA polymerase sigma factor (sigma-70 family)